MKITARAFDFMDLAMSEKPKVFIGSSSEGLTVARAVQFNMDHVAACTIWNQGAFGLGLSNIENLISAARGSQFAILIVTADDYKNRRGRLGYSPRDNVIFELGLFMGILGRSRTYIVYDRDRRPMLPSDLDGMGIATYSLDGHSSVRAALGAACTDMEEMIQRELAASATGRRKG